MVIRLFRSLYVVDANLLGEIKEAIVAAHEDAPPHLRAGH